MFCAAGYLIAGPSSKINELEKEKILVQIELRAIKSVQLELVKNSKLERKVIKIDKEIETLNAQQEPKVEKTRKVLRILRVSPVSLPDGACAHHIPFRPSSTLQCASS